MKRFFLLTVALLTVWAAAAQMLIRGTFLEGLTLAIRN